MRKLWTIEEIELLKQLYPSVNTSDVAREMGRSYSSVSAMASILKIHKSASFLSSELSGRGNMRNNENTRFKKGQIAWNKGKKMHEEVKRKVEHTFFSKGHKPHNTLYDGAIVIRDGYYYIRISEGKWIELHRYIWEKEHGKQPKGYNVVFKDNNRKNCVLENLELVSNAELMIRNTIHRYPEEIKKTISAITKLKKTIRKHEEQN